MATPITASTPSPRIVEQVLRLRNVRRFQSHGCAAATQRKLEAILKDNPEVATWLQEHRDHYGVSL